MIKQFVYLPTHYHWSKHLNEFLYDIISQKDLIIGPQNFCVINQVY